MQVKVIAENEIEEYIGKYTILVEYATADTVGQIFVKRVGGTLMDIQSNRAITLDRLVILRIMIVTSGEIAPKIHANNLEAYYDWASTYLFERTPITGR